MEILNELVLSLLNYFGKKAFDHCGRPCGQLKKEIIVC